jgi:hypothetical protein
VNDERIETAYRRGLADPTTDRSQCVAPDDLQTLASGGGTESDRLRLLDHVMACGSCRNEFELLRSISEAERLDRPSRRWSPLALAASIVGVAIAGTVWQMTRPEVPVFRDAPSAVTAVAPVGTVASVDAFRWTASDMDAEYELEVVDAEGGIVFRGVTADTVLAMPDSVALRPGVDYRWTLTVVSLETGAVTLPSTAFRVR